MANSPLEQFSVFKVAGLPYLTLTNSMWFGTLGRVVWAATNYHSSGASASVVPSRWTTALGGVYSMVVAMIGQTVGTGKENLRRFFVYAFSLFSFILVLNLTGLVPYSFTVTSHLIVTLVLSLSLWIGKGNIATGRHGIRSVNLVYPKGVPVAMLAALVLIETIGFLITIVSLSVRLFANMMAGHILLKVLGGFAWTMALGSGVLFLAHVLPLLVLYVMMGLETGIAFVQAYVFVLLSCIYLADATHGGH